jgi:predicted acetyltransferase
VNPRSYSIHGILCHINDEFILKKGKTLGLEHRYPGLFSGKNLHNLYVLKVGNRLASFVAVKPMHLRCRGTITNVFLIGCVYTDPMLRARGFATALLREVANRYTTRNYSAGILWTTMPQFYKKLGWVCYDNGVFLKCCEPVLGKSASRTGRFEILDNCDFEAFNNLRTELLRDRHFVVRDNSLVKSYDVVPSPAEYRRILVHYDSSDKMKGYLIFGVKDSDLYVYEIISNQTGYSLRFINELTWAYPESEIFLNLPKEDTITRRLGEVFKRVATSDQRLGMYYCFDEKVIRKIKKTYIPLIDRI